MRTRRVGTAALLILILVLASSYGIPRTQNDSNNLFGNFHIGGSHAALAATSPISVKSGSWSDPTSWSTGVVPTTGDSVTIKSGHTVTYDVASDSVLGQISIEGTLRFSRNTDTRLKTNASVVAQPGGFLDMGTSSDPIPSTVKAEVIWQLTQSQANSFVPVSSHIVVPQSPGLYALSNSTWQVHGAPISRTWTKLAQDKF